MSGREEGKRDEELALNESTGVRSRKRMGEVGTGKGRKCSFMTPHDHITDTSHSTTVSATSLD